VRSPDLGIAKRKCVDSVLYTGASSRTTKKLSEQWQELFPFPTELFERKIPGAFSIYIY
jgi:hypothetical protein